MLRINHFASLSMLFAVAGLQAGEPWQHLNEDGIRIAISGRELAGDSGSKHLYLVDGTVKGTDAGHPFQGRWRVERDELCIARMPQPNEECFELQKKGVDLRFLQDGYVVFQGRLNTVRKPADGPPAR